MEIEFKPDGSFRLRVRESTARWYVIGRMLWMLVLGVLVGMAATRAYFVGILGM